MTLIKPMKRALEIVRMFNGLEREQLRFFLKKEYHNRYGDIDRLLRTRLIYEEDERIYIPDMEVAPSICEAVRILQIFWSKNLVDYYKGKSPVLAVYVKQTKNELRKFHICTDENVSDLRVSDDNAAVIVITDNRQLQCPHLRNYYLAVLENGKYNFYKKEW